MVFVCHFFCLPLLFLSLCSTPPHSSSTNPKFWYQKEQHIMAFIPLKYFWVPVWGRETKKKNFMFSKMGFVFLHRTHHLSLDSQGIKNFEVCRNRATNLMISLKKSGSLKGAAGKISLCFCSPLKSHLHPIPLHINQTSSIACRREGEKIYQLI